LTRSGVSGWIEDRRGSGNEIIAGLGTRLILDRLLQIVVEIFIRVVFRRIGREIKDLDFDLVARQPILNRLGMMDAQIVDNQKDLLLRVLEEPLHEINEDRDVQRTLVELEPHEAAIANGGDHTRRELLSRLRQDRRPSFGA